MHLDDAGEGEREASQRSTEKHHHRAWTAVMQITIQTLLKQISCEIVILLHHYSHQRICDLLKYNVTVKYE